MRYFQIIVSYLFFFSALQIQAAFEDSVGIEESILPPDTQGKPFAITTDYDYIGYSKMKKDGFDCTKIRYNQLSILGSMVFYYKDCYKEGAVVQTGYTREQVYWFDNPFFKQDTFNTADVTFAVFSERLCNWRWVASVGMGYDTDRNNFSEATNWDLLMWGRFAYRHNIGLHIGFLAQTGMRIDHVYPIIGFDWEPRNRWTLNVVYPIDISLLYEINDRWSAGFAGRFFSSRHRLSPDDAIPNGLINYQNTGAEFRLTYDYTPWLSANAHIGNTFGGELKVANKKYQHKQHFKFKPAGYVGGELVINF